MPIPFRRKNAEKERKKKEKKKNMECLYLKRKDKIQTPPIIYIPFPQLFIKRRPLKNKRKK